MTEKLKQKARDFIKEYLRDNLILVKNAAFITKANSKCNLKKLFYCL